MWYKERGGQKSVYKSHKISLGIFISLYVLSVAICSLNFNHTNEPVEKDIFPDVHCGIELSSYVAPEDGSSAFSDLTSYRKLCPFIVEPKLPILVYSIFKIPKPA
jgi:hypothetical protein